MTDLSETIKRAADTSGRKRSAVGLLVDSVCNRTGMSESIEPQQVCQKRIQRATDMSERIQRLSVMLETI